MVMGQCQSPERGGERNGSGRFGNIWKKPITGVHVQRIALSERMLMADEDRCMYDAAGGVGREFRPCEDAN